MLAGWIASPSNHSGISGGIARGITAPVVYFPTFNDLLAAPDGSLTGKIAFVSNQMKAAQDGSGYGAYGAARFIGPNIAAKKGAAVKKAVTAAAAAIEILQIM